MSENTDAFRRAHQRQEQENRQRLQSLGAGAVVYQSLAFKGCTLSQYTSAYNSRGSELSYTVIVSLSTI